jgi:hypothetical protein
MTTFPLPDIVKVGSPVGHYNFKKLHLIAECAKVGAVLEIIANTDNAQIATPLHRYCQSAVLFTFAFSTTLPE